MVSQRPLKPLFLVRAQTPQHMKKSFYFFSALSLIAVLVGMIVFNNFRDRLYLLVMLVMFLAFVTGITYVGSSKN